MLERILRLTTAYPGRVLAVLGIVCVFGGFIGSPVKGLLNADNDSFHDLGSESTRAIEAIQRSSGVLSGPELLVVVDRDRPLSLDTVASTLCSDPDVARVVGGSGRDRNDVCRRGSPARAADPQPFVSRDGSKVYFSAVYRASAVANATTRRLLAGLAGIPGVRPGGVGPVYDAVNDQVAHDLTTAELLAFPLLFIAALVTFRSVISAFLPLLVGGFTIVISMMILRVVNAQMAISVFALNLVTGLGLGLAIDYSLFLVSRFREELDRAGEVAEAVRNTVQTAGRTVAYSAVTVAGSGLALLVFPLRFLYSMGVGVIITALVAAIGALVMLPALFAVLGPQVNALGLERWRQAMRAEARAEKSGFWYRLSQFVMRHHALVAVTAVAIVLVLGIPFLRIRFTGIDVSVLPDDAPARIATMELRDDFAAADVNPIMVEVSHPAAGPSGEDSSMTDYTNRLRHLPHVKWVTEARYLGADTWQIGVIADAPALADHTYQLVRDVRALKAPGGSLVGGTTANQIDQLSALRRNLPASLAILAMLVLVALFLMTGSVVLPLKAIVMNLLTISATLGILVFIFQDGRFENLLDYHGQGALESAQITFLFVVAFGLATDYAVFLLMRIKEARDHGAGERESVALGLQRTGRIVTAAAVLFAIAMGAFATSRIEFLKELGLGIALSVLIDATIIRALLVPSLMALMGKWNWWAPDRLRRLHARFGVAAH